ncbi:hypothetical protein Tcan_05626 [Toxocara canis]|uniref:Uncharacterized protein n=1 Tax=Toxocara canis TaxID=6265 RepID=A0A0B2VSD5_TOXCA|nr:hypothetical protein Tcan_05626 [Toxocara canis]
MLNETKKYPVIVSSSEDAHKLQEDEVALCCCEYVDEHGTKRHLLQTFCECVELDEFVSRNGAILYRTSLTLLLLLINFSTLFMKCYKKTRKRR